jgi:hypothetical protein
MMAPPATDLYFRILHTYFSTYFNISTHFGIAKLSTSILRPKIIQFKMKSIFKMAILRLSIRSTESCISAIFRPIIFLDSFRRLYKNQ